MALKVEPLSNSGPDQPLLDSIITCVSVNEPLIHAGLVDDGVHGVEEARNFTSLSM